MVNHSLVGILSAAFFFSLIACNSGENTSAVLNDQQQLIDTPMHFGFGEQATVEKITLLDLDVRPDGKGLPEGSGSVAAGGHIYAAKCASCHGQSGKEGPFAHLVSSDTSKAKTIGNYWPYATTLFDYIRRAMPYNAPGSLSNAEVYSVTTFLLHKNKLIDSTLVIDAKRLPAVGMPAKKLFVTDDREGGKEIR